MHKYQMYRRSAKISIHGTLKYESNKHLKSAKHWDPPCAAVGTASHQHGLEAGTMYGRSETVLNNDKAVPKLSTLNVHLSELQTSNLGINTKWMYLELNSQTYSSNVCVYNNSPHFQASLVGNSVTEGPYPLLHQSAHSAHKWMSGMIHHLAQVQSLWTPHHVPENIIILFITVQSQSFSCTVTLQLTVLQYTLITCFTSLTYSSKTAHQPD
jgi:hypothetical protein